MFMVTSVVDTQKEMEYFSLDFYCIPIFNIFQNGQKIRNNISTLSIPLKMAFSLFIHVCHDYKIQSLYDVYPKFVLIKRTFKLLKYKPLYLNVLFYATSPFLKPLLKPQFINAYLRKDDSKCAKYNVHTNVHR